MACAMNPSGYAGSIRSAIEIDLDNLQEYAGIKPDDIGTRDWLRNEEKTPLKAEDILASPESHPSYQKISIDHSETPPVQFTFKSAVKFVVDMINERASFGENMPQDWQIAPLTLLKKKLINDLTNIDTPNPELIGDTICTQQKFWFGTIISLLREKGHIEGFNFYGDGKIIFVKGQLIDLV